MNHRVLPCLFILILLSLHCVSAARLFTSTEPASTLSGIYKDNAISKKGGSERNNDDNPWKLMGMEECKNGDEECEKRRLLSEAHLDYIYTQGHKKQP